MIRTTLSSASVRLQELVDVAFQEVLDGGVSWRRGWKADEADVEFEGLGHMSGSTTIWDDGLVTASLRSRDSVPVQWRDEARQLFAEENTPEGASKWEFAGRGRIQLRVRELELRGNPEQRTRQIQKHLVERLVVMHQRITELLATTR